MTTQRKVLFSQLPQSHWWANGVPAYENNWAMQDRRVPDQKQVLTEHTGCLNILQKHTDLEIIPFPKEYDADGLNKHDLIFVRDSFISNQKGSVVISNFRERERQPEAEFLKQYLRTRGHTQHTLADTAYAEGGEFYYAPEEDILFAGTSRNNKKGVIETARLLNIKKVCIVETNSFHLDTVFTIMLNKQGSLTGIIACMKLINNPELVEKFALRQRIALIDINPIDSIDFDGRGKISVNCLPTPGKLLGGNEFITPGVEEKIKHLGIEHIVSPITQFLYSAGGIHCLTNEL